MEASHKEVMAIMRSSCKEKKASQEEKLAKMKVHHKVIVIMGADQEELKPPWVRGSLGKSIKKKPL
jgi:hypothetical protein